MLRRSAKQAAKEIMMAVLLGMDFKRPSPCTAARMTFSAEERPAAWKKRLTSGGAVGWLITLLYVDRRVWETRISTYGGILFSIPKY